MKSFKQYLQERIVFLTLLEGRLTDFRAANPHLSFLSDKHALKYGPGLTRMQDVPEDPQKVIGTLNNFDVHGSKLKDNLKDFNQHPSFEAVQSALQPYVEKSQTQKAQQEKATKGAPIVFDDGNGLTVRHIDTKDASCKYGAGTKWCVSASKNNMFSQYKKGTSWLGGNQNNKMYTIHTPDGRKFAYHEGELNMARDEKNEEVDIRDLVKQYPSLSNSEELRKSKYGISFLRNENEINNAIFEKLKSNDQDERQAAISHPYATPEHLLAAMDDEASEVQEEAMKHKNATPEVLEKGINKNFEVGRLAGVHPNLSTQQKNKIMRGNNWYAKSGLAENPTVSPEHLHKLLDVINKGPMDDRNGSFMARAAAVKSKNLSDKNIEKALKDPSETVVVGLMMNPVLKSNHVSQGFKSKYELVRAKAAAHPNASLQDLQMVMNNKKENSAIRDQAKMNYEKKINQK